MVEILDVSAYCAYDAVATEPDWATVIENCVLSPLVNVIVVFTTLAVIILLVARDEVTAYEEDTALLAQLLVPINVPTNEPVNEPVLI